MRLVFAVLISVSLHAQGIQAVAVGHEQRQDDLPSIAVGPDGSAWVAWLSWVGNRDDVAIRQYKNNKWGSLQWVPNTSGDSWLPQVGVDASNRVWVVWSQGEDGNWDIYARRFDPALQEWSVAQRITSDPQPDINPRIASDGKGRIAVVWQGFRNGSSDIFTSALDGEKWSAELRVTRTPGNEWDPAAAFDTRGNLWVAYDGYRKDDYDVFLSRVSDGRLASEVAVADTTRFEARATVAVAAGDRVCVAWEEGLAGWGKDQGYILRGRPRGVNLGGVRVAKLRCRDSAGSLQAAQTVPFGAGNAYAPHLYADAKGGLWAVANRRLDTPNPGGGSARGYFEYWIARHDGKGWSKPEALPEAKGRSSTRPGGAALADGTMLFTWPTDSRIAPMYHRPHRQRVYAAAVGIPAASPAPAPARTRDVLSATGHPNEAADLKAIREYSVNIGGKKNNIVRGDFHRHTELSWDGGGGGDGSLQDFYRYMIDAASMDFGASTDHQGGAWPYWWWYSQKMTDMYHLPGTYIPIFGYERSAVFPNGHRNMFFAKRSSARVTPFLLRSGVPAFSLPQSPMGDEPGIGTGDLVTNDTKLLYEEIRKLGGVAISHTSGTRMGTDWRDNDPDLEPVVEIFQGARTNYEKLGAPFVVKMGVDDEHVKRAGYQPEGMVANAWAKGYKLGIITSSDHGSTHISYAMVYTPDKSRQGILDAIRRRHTYGATDNIILDVRMGDRFMGDEFSTGKADPIKVKIRGTGPVARVDIIKDNEVIYTTEPNKQDVSFEYTDRSGVSGRHFYYVRVQQRDSMIAWSSPFFLNYK